MPSGFFVPLPYMTPVDTPVQYDAVIAQCKALFLNKARDYGTAWQVLRLPSVTDQIYIKAQRIRSIQETGENRVGDSIDGEFIGIINYCVIALMLEEVQLHHQGAIPAQWSELSALEHAYAHHAERARSTMLAKNHDYGEAWRNMRISSITDLMLMKIFRLKQIEDNDGKTLVSEGVAANYIDMLNYSVFCLILMSEGQSAT